MFVNCSTNKEIILADNYLSKAEEFYEEAKNNNKPLLIDSSLYYYGKSAPLYIKNKKYRAYIAVCNKEGEMFLFKDQFDKASKKYKGAFNISKTKFHKSDTLYIKGLQKIAGIFHYTGKLDSQMIYYKKAYYLTLKYHSENKKLSANSYHYLGSAYYNKRLYDSANYYLEKAYQIKKQLYSDEDIEMTSIYIDLGYVKGKLKESKKMLSLFEKALKININYYGSNNWKIVDLYNNIGFYYAKRNFDTETALANYLKAKEIVDNTLGVQQTVKANVYQNIASIYGLMAANLKRDKNYNKGKYAELKNTERKLLGELINIYEEAFGAKKNDEIANMYNNLGISYFSKPRNIFKSKKYLNKSLQIRKAIYGKKAPLVSTSYKLIASLNNHLNNYNFALLYLDSAKMSLPDEYKFDYHDALIQKVYTDIYSNLKQYDTALFFCQKALNYFCLNFSDSLISVNPSSIQASNHIYSLYTLVTKANILHKKYYNSTNINKLKLVVDACDSTIATNKIFRNRVSGEKAKLSYNWFPRFVSEIALHSLTKLYRITKKLEYLNKIIFYQNKSKTSYLNQLINNINYQEIAKIPQEYIKYETKLSNKINTATADLEKNKVPIDTLLAAHSAYDSLITFYKTKYPFYYRLKYKEYYANIESIQSNLNKQSAIIKYFVGDSLLNILIITKYKSSVFSRKLPKNFKKLSDNYYKEIGTFDEESFIKTSHKLYKILFGKEIEQELRNINELIIIPDRNLQKTVFEALQCTEEYNDFLIKKFAISYHYSSTLWNEKKNQKAINFKKDFAGFAPIKFNKTDKTVPLKSCLGSWSNLPETKKELEAIETLFSKAEYSNFDKYFYDKASENQFKKNISQYKFVHLSTHACYSPKTNDSKIVFFINDTIANSDSTKILKNNFLNNGFLYLSEVYSLKLNTELIVLNACETGIGEKIIGENMFAFNRGFFIAGAQNIIYSLWEIDQKSSKELIINFYKNYLSGMTYKKALQKAKIEMIEENSVRDWASLIILGD